jgi:hypothetical protein
MFLECSKCEDLVDVETRTVVAPFVCKWCEEGFIVDYPKYIIEVFLTLSGWQRSIDLNGVFSSYDEAQAAIDSFQDSMTRRVVPLASPTPPQPQSPAYMDYVHMDDSNDSDNSDDPNHPDDILGIDPVPVDNQFALDTKLIEDIEAQLAEANSMIDCYEKTTSTLQKIVDEQESDIRVYRKLLGLSVSENC